jgi:predicted nicotinamide N-methyase
LFLQQVSDRLMEHMAHLATIPRRHPSDEAQELCVHCYFPPLALDAAGLKPILVNEARNLLSRGNNVGLRTWEAALHLAWYLMTVHRPGLVRGRNVLELGAGTGFLSLLCAGQLEAGHVLATDGLGHVCESMQANFDLNENEHQGTLRGRPPPQARQLDWTDPSEIDRLLAGDVQYDLVIGADITYHPDILRPLAELLSRLKDKFPNVVIIISATIRSDTFAQFVAICRDLGFQVKELNCDIPDGLRYSGFFHSVATEIKIVSLER